MDLIIVGAGGLGREIFFWLSQEILTKGGYRIKGFIDSEPDRLGQRNYPAGVIGSIADYTPNETEELVLAIQDPKTKKVYVESLLDKGATFYSLVHPSAVIGYNVNFGDGCVVCPNCIFTNDITIGDFVFLNTNSTVGHDSTIGDYTSINGNVDITGEVKVGSGCLFGVGSKIIPGRRIGDGATIGAGSVVIRNVPPGVTVFGNPAKKI